VNRDPVLKTFLLTEVNHHIRDLAADADWDAGDPEWEFFCECGRRDCHEQVKLTLDAYVALGDGNRPVLAPGHRLSQVERARRLREETQALLAQAEQQVKRAQRNTRAGR
jgi:hypothetical protein